MPALFKERHVYFFKCKNCKNDRRWSFKRRIAEKVKLCRRCRGKYPLPNPNQLSLLEPPNPVTINGVTYSFEEKKEAVCNSLAGSS